MDYAVESLEKTSDIERKAAINKLHNMQWLKNTSHSANPAKIKAAVYKHLQDQDEDKKIEDKVLTLKKIVKIHLGEESNKNSSIDDTCLYNDTVPENAENMWSKNIDTANLFPNADNLADQKNEEDMLSIVESIVTAKLETEFCMNKDQSSSKSDNSEDITQDVVCTNPSDLQKTDELAEEQKIKQWLSDGNNQSDGNNNESKSIIPCMSKMNDKQKSTCKITNVESNETSIGVKDKDIKTNNITKTHIKVSSNTNLTKDNEKFSNNFKKVVYNPLKPLSTSDKNGRDHLNNKQTNAKNAPIRKQEFAKQRNIPRNDIEKEMKNVIVKPNLAKTGDTICQSKNSNKDKVLQKQQQTSKQFASRSKGQESIRKNSSTLNSSDDKNKTEKVYTSENFDSPLNDSERKNEKIVEEKNIQSDQKANCDVDLKKNIFVAQYKNSTFSKSMQNIPRTGQAPIYGRNPLYAYNNQKFDKDRNGSVERRITKKDYAPINTFTKSNTRTEEFDTSNLESCSKLKKEIVQSTNVKSTCEVNTLEFNNKKDINSVKVETHLVQSKENTNSSTDYPEQGPTTSESTTLKCHIKTTDISKIDIDRQHTEINNEEIDSFKHSSILLSDKCDTNSQINVIHQYPVLELESIQCTSEVNQLENNQTTWNQSSTQKDASVINLQQSIQSMHFNNTQQTFAQAGNPTRQMSPWEPNNSNFYDQHFSVNDVMRQIPNTFNSPPYECNVQMLSDNSVTTTSTLETTMNNREHSNVLYRPYGPNVQQRPIMASDFPGHSIPPCQTRWSSSVQDGFHVEHPYVTTQSTMMHVYNPAAFGPDDFNNTHTMDYVSHPIIYAPSPYMQTWNSQYPMPVLYNSPCTNYTTFSHNNQPNHFNNSIHEQQHKHNPYMQMNNYVRDTYTCNDTNTCAVQTRNTIDNIPIKSNYYKKYQDNRAIYDVPQYIPPVSRSQQGMNFMPATGLNQYNAPYYPPNQKYYKQNITNYVKNPKSQTQDFVCDDNGLEDIPPIISPKEFVTNNINLSNKTDQFATRVFKPEFKTKSNSGYRPPASLLRYSGNFRKNTFSNATTYQDFPKEYTYPVSIGRGTYKTKKT